MLKYIKRYLRLRGYTIVKQDYMNNLMDKLHKYKHGLNE